MQRAAFAQMKSPPTGDRGASKALSLACGIIIALLKTDWDFSAQFETRAPPGGLAFRARRRSPLLFWLKSFDPGCAFPKLNGMSIDKLLGSFPGCRLIGEHQVHPKRYVPVSPDYVSSIFAHGHAVECFVEAGLAPI
jgi:hypothetical protein